MNAPKSLAERQAALAAEVAKIEGKRDKAVRNLERQLEVARAQGTKEIAHLRAAERAEHAEICRQLAAEEISLLLTSTYHALRSYQPADIAVLAGHYKSANEKSLLLAGYDLLATGRLGFIVAEVLALREGMFELGTQKGLPVGGIVGYSPSARTFEASVIEWMPSHMLVAQPVQRLHMQLLGRNRHAAADALRDLEEGLLQLLSTGYTAGDNWDLDARWRALRYSGSREQIFEAMQAVRQAEQAPAVAEQARRSALQAARYSAQQAVYAGKSTLRDAMAGLRAMFGDDAGPSLHNPDRVELIASGQPAPSPFAPGRDSISHRNEIDMTGAHTDDALPPVNPLGPEGHPEHLLSKDGYPVTNWVNL